MTEGNPAADQDIGWSPPKATVPRRSQIQPSGSASRIDSSWSTTLRSRSTSSAAKSGRLSMSQMTSASSSIAVAGPSAKYATSSVSVYALVFAPTVDLPRDDLGRGATLGALEEHVL